MNLHSFDALLHLGDYDYKCEPDSYFSKILSSSRKYKFFGILGNHEDKSECGETKYYRYVDNIYNEMKKNHGTSCVFSPKKTMWSCVYKNVVSIEKWNKIIYLYIDIYKVNLYS